MINAFKKCKAEHDVRFKGEDKVQPRSWKIYHPLMPKVKDRAYQGYYVNSSFKLESQNHRRKWNLA